MPRERRRYALVDDHGAFAVGVENGDRDVSRAIGLRGVGETHLVVAGLRNHRHERDGATAFVLVVVGQVAGAEIRLHGRRAAPAADDLRLLVVEDDAGERCECDRLTGGGRTGGLAQPGNLFFERGNLGLLRSELELHRRIRRQRGIHPLRDVISVVVQRMRAAENPGERVIVARRHGIEFVIMAARAANRHPEKGLAERVELLVHDVHAERVFILLLIVGRAQREKRRRGNLAGLFIGRRGGQEIAGELLADKLVEGQVAVKRVHHIVAVAPRVLEHQGAPAATRFRKARHIEPVPAPALAELRRGQHCIHYDRERLGRGPRITHKRLERLRRRRQSGQVERRAAQERCAVGIAGGLEAFSRPGRSDKTVDRGAGPVVRRRWDHWFHRRHEGPEFFPFLDRETDLFRFRIRRAGRLRSEGGRRSFGRGRAAFHPLFKERNFFTRQLGLGRHRLEIESRVAHRLNQRTLLDVTRHDRRAGIAAHPPTFRMIKA